MPREIDYVRAYAEMYPDKDIYTNGDDVYEIVNDKRTKIATKQDFEQRANELELERIDKTNDAKVVLDALHTLTVDEINWIKQQYAQRNR